MTEPTTPTGKRLWGKQVLYGYVHESEVLAIEAEARQQERERLRGLLCESEWECDHDWHFVLGVARDDPDPLDPEPQP